MPALGHRAGAAGPKPLPARSRSSIVSNALDYNAPITKTYPSLSIVAAGRSESHERLRGIASMIGAVFVFAIMDAQMKRLSVHYGPFQVSCLRCVSSLLCLLPTIAWKRPWAGMRARTPWLHLVRGALGVIMLGSFVYAVRSLSLAQTYSVFLAAPLLMTALSVPLLREQVS